MSAVASCSNRNICSLWSRLLLALALVGSAQAGSLTYLASPLAPPSPAREMRAVWIATVANLDWPATNCVDSNQQKAALVAMLDRAAQLKFNVVFLQVRPCCDAFYASSLEPWSEYLTGTMGKAPRPYYDPLAFAIQEAHKRGLELHAWFNPFRARHILVRSPISSSHIIRTHPELVRRYGSFLWLDPGERAVQDYSLRVILDVVRRYDIDGVHFDDYFYPYKEKNAAGKELDFPDDSSWRRFGVRSGMSRQDWRRDNINRFIQKVYVSIKATKPWVKFGVSPFGIWRPKNPPQIQGLDAYQDHYADSRLWLSKGWVDYLVPQLYWPITPPAQSFPALLNWWAEQNPRNRVLVAGLNTYNTSQTWQPQEISNQIRLARHQSGASGHAHWRMSTLMGNLALDTLLMRDYSQPALPPAFPWLAGSAPQKPLLKVSGARFPRLNWSANPGEQIAHWVLQTRSGGLWKTEFLPGSMASGEFRSSTPEVIALTPIDRCGRAGVPAVYSLLSESRRAEACAAAPDNPELAPGDTSLDLDSKVKGF